MNCALSLVKAARATPNKTAVRCGGRHISFRNLDIRSNRLANAFRDLGIGPAVRALSMMPDSVDRVIVYYALAKAGIVEVVVNYEASDELLRQAVAETQPKMFIGSEPYLSGVRKVFSTMRGPSLRFALEVAKESEFIDLNAAYSNRPEFPIHPADGDDWVSILYTESRESLSMSHENVAEMCRILTEVEGTLESETVVIGAFPLNQVLGLGMVLNGSVSRGLTVELCSRYGADQIVALLEAERQTMIYAPQDRISRLVEIARKHPPRRQSLRFCMTEDSSVPREVNRRFEDIFGVAVFPCPESIRIHGHRKITGKQGVSTVLSAKETGHSGQDGQEPES